MRRFKNSRLCEAMVLVTLLFLNGSCMNGGKSPLRRPQNEPEYQILSKAQADDLLRKIRSQNADIEIVEQFFSNKSFYLRSVQAVTQGSRVACIALYGAAGDDERLGILAIKLRGDVVVETTSGIVWNTVLGSEVIANELEGPKLTSTSTMSLSGWWDCVINHAGRTCESLSRSYFYYPGCLYLAARIEALCGFPLVYYWFRGCY